MHAEIVGWMSREPEKMIGEMLVAIGDNLSDLARSDNWKDGEDEDDDGAEQGKLSEDDEPGWVMGTISKMVQQCMERFRQKQMKFDEWTQQGSEDAAEYFRERDMKYGTSELSIPAVVQLETNEDALAPQPTQFGELIASLEVVHRSCERPKGTSRPGSSHIWLGSVKAPSKLSIPSGGPAAEPYSSMLLKAKPVESVSFYPWI